MRVSVEQKVSQRTKTLFPRETIKILRYRERVALALLSLQINRDTHQSEI
jgi:hypothetical protein